MKIHSLFLTLFCVICFSANAQVDTFQKDIVELLNNNGTNLQREESYDTMFNSLQQQFSTANVPDAFWEQLQEDKSEAIQALVTFSTFAYRKHFTQQEIQQMIAFYGTEAAQKRFVQKVPLSEKEAEIITQFFQTDLWIKLEARQQLLSKDLLEIRKHWSRDLFAKKMSALVKAGYVPQ
ncbi:DUF2059 domain-containing protein [Altibacter sp.]|uniref:DUF2059 domain-containing protein n=1 Tax=Altibacter sp. TaxID=2024823 RepID=UPI000C95C8ED|nr:DUF2059 domain-containing protein [Altibacter sp.]MAP54580.1 hypothetical protein [Altibacter sp.]|tara:strand:+ start:657 stop:1193 length:537 start_codon:yes stop_codon:yes gene_type:complete